MKSRRVTALTPLIAFLYDQSSSDSGAVLNANQLGEPNNFTLQMQAVNKKSKPSALSIRNQCRAWRVFVLFALCLPVVVGQ